MRVSTDCLLSLANTTSGVGDTFYFQFLGSNCDYIEVLNKQVEIAQHIEKFKDLNLLACEHKPVFTAGRSIKMDLIEPLKFKSGCDVVSVSRGGAFMFHGPGQLTLYFIFKLKKYFSGPKDYIECLTEVVKEYFLERHEKKLIFKNNGLWFNNKKVGFLGIRIENGVVYHGLSLNYHINKDPFQLQTPCDIKGDEVGNIFDSPLSALFLEDESKSIGQLFYERISPIDKAPC